MLPPIARPLGFAGLIPFAGLAIGAWLGWRWAPEALAAYGATILAFLGAVHWGLGLRASGDERGAEAARFGLGVVPALVGWVALLLPVGAGLVVLAAGILATAAVEQLGTRAGLVPPDYQRLRWPLSLGASASLLSGALVVA
jgi:hypothetical protein